MNPLNVLLEPVLSNSLLAAFSFIAVYAFLGGSIKFIDDAFDEKLYNQNLATIWAVITAIVWASVMTISPASATILGAIVLCVFLKGKVDNIAFQVGVVAIFVILFFSGFLDFLWIPLIFITIAGVLDEIGNDFFDKVGKERSKFFYYFFEYRFVMKIAVLTFALLGFFEFYYFLAFLAWDIAYAAVTLFSKKKKMRWAYNGALHS